MCRIFLIIQKSSFRHTYTSVIEGLKAVVVVVVTGQWLDAHARRLVESKNRSWPNDHFIRRLFIVFATTDTSSARKKNERTIVSLNRVRTKNRRHALRHLPSVVAVVRRSESEHPPDMTRGLRLTSCETLHCDHLTAVEVPLEFLLCFEQTTKTNPRLPNCCRFRNDLISSDRQHQSTHYVFKTIERFRRDAVCNVTCWLDRFVALILLLDSLHG